MISPNNADIAITPNPLLTIQYLNGNAVTFEEQESALRTDSIWCYVPGINIGATPAERHVYRGAAVSQLFDVVSISNLNNTNLISGTLILQDKNGNPVATAPIPAIPPVVQPVRPCVLDAVPKTYGGLRAASAPPIA